MAVWQSLEHKMTNAVSKIGGNTSNLGPSQAIPSQAAKAERNAQEKCREKK